MSWFSGSYSKLKSGWQHFREWERVVVLREKEWRIPIYRTDAEFERYFDSLILGVTRDDFFRTYDSVKERETFGFNISGEVAFKTPRSRAAILMTLTFSFLFPKYYFHGTLNKTDNERYIYGHYRAARYGADKWLRWPNFILIAYALFLIVVATSSAFGFPLEIADDHRFGFEGIVFSFVLVCVYLLGLSAIYLEIYSRGTRAEAHRILSEICGSPPSRKVTK